MFGHPIAGPLRLFSEFTPVKLTDYPFLINRIYISENRRSGAWSFWGNFSIQTKTWAINGGKDSADEKKMEL